MDRKRRARGDLGELLRRVKDECGPELKDCRDVFIYASGLTDDALKRRLQAPISDGLAMAYSETGLKLLLKEFGTEAGVGKELGVSQSAVSQMLSRRSLSTRHLVYVSFRYDAFDIEAQEGAVLGAWSCAADYIRRAVVAPGGAGRPPVCTMDYEECACLAAAVIDPARRAARETGNRFARRESTERIIDATRGIAWIQDLYGTLRRSWRVRASPDLDQLEHEWREALLIAAWFIPVKGTSP